MKYHIYGYVDPSNEFVDSQKVPTKYTKTYGQKNGFTHFDVFGHITTGSMYTWRVIGKKVVWYTKPPNDLKVAVENHLYNRYGLENISHDW